MPLKSESGVKSFSPNLVVYMAVKMTQGTRVFLPQYTTVGKLRSTAATPSSALPCLAENIKTLELFIRLCQNQRSTTTADKTNKNNSYTQVSHAFVFLSCYLDENSLRKPSYCHCTSKVLGSRGLQRSLRRNLFSIKDIYQRPHMGEAIPVVHIGNVFITYYSQRKHC